MSKEDCRAEEIERREGIAAWKQASAAQAGLRLKGPVGTVQALPGRLSALSVSNSKFGFVWRFCMGAEGA